MTVHGGEWRERDGYSRCSHCGSITPAEALRRMTTPGCRFSGTDKGGYKFYFWDEARADHGKFYGEHLAALTREELDAWAAVSRRVLGVDWVFSDSGSPGCRMPSSGGNFYGWQTWGEIGTDGNPVFDEASPRPPDETWWSTATEGNQ